MCLMKRTILFLTAAFLLTGCQYEKAITGSPTVTFDEESLTVQAGYSFDIVGTAEAAAGIEYISVKCAAYSVDKTYDLSKYAPASYRFTVTLTAPSGITGEEKVTVEVMGVDGSKGSGSLPVLFDGDSDKPVISVDATGDTQLSTEGTAIYSYSAALVDNQGLAQATLSCEALSLNKTWTLGGASEVISEEISFAAAGDYTLSLTVTDITGNTESAATVVTVWPTDTEAPVITYNGTADLSFTLDAASVDWTFAANVSDNQRLAGMQVYLVSPDWATTYYNETPDVAGLASYDYSHTFSFTETGDYMLYVYVNDASTTVQSWGNSAELYVNIHVKSPDAEAPSIVMNSPATVKLGDPYTLSLTFADESGIPECWPKICVYNGNGTEPTEIASNWHGWWPTVSGTSVTAELALTFTEAGEYKVWIDPVTDAVGNATEGKEWFTISVTDSTPTYLTLDQLPTSLNLSRVGGVASYTLYMKGERTDATTYTGVEFDLYDSAWNKLVPYGCTNTWDWGEWGMYGKASYQLDKVISFDTAGFYYLYIGEKWGTDGYAGHQIDITVE